MIGGVLSTLAKNNNAKDCDKSDNLQKQQPQTADNYSGYSLRNSLTSSLESCALNSHGLEPKMKAKAKIRVERMMVYTSMSSCEAWRSHSAL